jgi:hypothetical protein
MSGERIDPQSEEKLESVFTKIEYAPVRVRELMKELVEMPAEEGMTQSQLLEQVELMFSPKTTKEDFIEYYIRLHKELGFEDDLSRDDAERIAEETMKNRVILPED